ncbi:energy-coupling factor transport system permease protein [Evansella caseinilytica]|uniref:Energy-coupling factor transporter transmembrane protein EcfT n=1 Tax=Evansella caseinilytica TaxID=1503961 RepID=A0A1H3UM33_9BACI|nr:energy-coupling factor transporter transmembrane component T [Evansella caseinilytica]SDZ62789.1 energy-coupling factor transport system permease protein [Evansella caseinilytica]
MLDHIIIGRYIPGNSYIHQMDPRAKLNCIMIFMVFIFVSKHPAVTAIAFVLAAAAFILAKIPFRFYLKGMKVIAIIIFFTFCLHLFMTEGGPVLLQTPVTTIYLGGLTEGLIVALRLLMLVTMASLITLTTTPVDLTDGLEALLKPFQKLGLPTHELALMMSIALRFIPTLLEEAVKIYKAQMARGANFTEGSLLKRIKAFIPILVPLFVQSFRRAEDLATAMEARGYEGGDSRTKYRLLRWKRRDTAAVAVFAAFAVLTVCVRLFL